MNERFGIIEVTMDGRRYRVRDRGEHWSSRLVFNTRQDAELRCAELNDRDDLNGSRYIVEETGD